MSCFMFFEREEREKEMRQTPIDLAGFSHLNQKKKTFFSSSSLTVCLSAGGFPS